jgi:hypothetical protein
MNEMKLTRADEVLAPQRARDFKAERDKRAKDRAETMRRALEELFGLEAFEEFLDSIVIAFGYWRLPNHTMTEFEQGQRAMIHELVERILAYGGSQAEDWFADSAERFAKWISTERKMK